MRKILFITLLAACLVAGIFNRTYNALDRIPHADESEQAIVFEKLYTLSEYSYNPNGPHGPSFYYYADAVARICGEPKAEELQIPFLRSLLLPISAVILLFYALFAPYIGRIAAGGACCAFLMASCAQIYSVYFVHEILFALAILGTAQSVWKFALRPSALAACSAGLFAGLAQSTKETSIIAFAAIFGALAVAAMLNADIRYNLRKVFSARSGLLLSGCVVFTFAAICAALYSSFGYNWDGLKDAVLSYFHFFDKSGSIAHAHDWAFYLKLFTIQKSGGMYFGELAITILAVIGFIWAFFARGAEKNRADAAIFMFLSGAFAVAILSALSYKTPWLILSPEILIFLTAGYGVQKILEQDNRKLFAVGSVFIIALGLLQFKLSSNAARRFDCDPRNPFIYTHTVRDFDNLIKRICGAAKVSEYGFDIPVAFITKTSPWPAPWYLRDYRNIGFWGTKMPKDISPYEIVVCDHFTQNLVENAIKKDDFTSEFFGVRKNLIYTVYIKKRLFEALTKE